MTDDWFEFLAALLDADARFLVVGAHAMAVHGVPRGTQDLDVWIDPDPANAGRVWQGRIEHEVRGRVVPFLGRADLVATKRATDRPKDRADLAALGEGS